MKEERPIIYVIGNIHVKEIPSSKIAVLKPIPQVILGEGINAKDIFSIKNFLKAPEFVIATPFWFLFLKFFGEENKSIKKISEKLKLETISVEGNVTEMINMFFPKNYLVIIICFFIYYFLVPKSIINFIAFLLAIPFLFDILLTLNSRNKNMVKNIERIIRDKKFKTVLFHCGALHKEEIIKFLEEKQFNVKEI